jgi:hypothetical protein
MNPQPYYQGFGVLSFAALCLYLTGDFWLPLVMAAVLAIGITLATRKNSHAPHPILAAPVGRCRAPALPRRTAAAHADDPACRPTDPGSFGGIASRGHMPRTDRDAPHLRVVA